MSDFPFASNTSNSLFTQQPLSSSRRSLHATHSLPASSGSLAAIDPSAIQQQQQVQTRRQPIERIGDIEISLKPSPQIPAFLTKLYNMVSDSSSNSMIRWQEPDGKSFVVCKHDDFAHAVLPRFFKHNNFSSFVRQLNMYGFHKVQHVLAGSLVGTGGGNNGSSADNSVDDCWEFENVNFQRNRPDLLPLVKRKASSSSAAAANSSTGSSTKLQKNSNDNTSQLMSLLSPSATSNSASLSSSIMPPMGQQEMENLLMELKHIKHTQSAISQELHQMRTQNQLLWQETLMQRQKHEQQQQVINKIVGFLSSVMSSEQVMKKLNQTSSSSANATAGGISAITEFGDFGPLHNTAIDSSSAAANQYNLNMAGSSMSSGSMNTGTGLLGAGQKRQRLLMDNPSRFSGASSDDDANLLFMDQASNPLAPNKIVELFQPDTPLQSHLNHNDLIANPAIPPTLAIQHPSTNMSHLETTIDGLQENLDDITDYLGLTDNDLQHLSAPQPNHIDSFFNDYLALDELNSEPDNQMQNM